MSFRRRILCLAWLILFQCQSIGDSFHSKTTTKDTFLPDQTTYSLAEQTNTYLQDAVRRDGKAYVVHLDGFIMALREELDTSGGLQSRNPPAVERKPYRMDVAPDGTGIESTGWFRMSSDTKPKGDSSMMSRLCALQWVVVLYESVVPDKLKAEVSSVNQPAASQCSSSIASVCERIHHAYHSPTG